MTTICLNMIVKNEAHCIARCLSSVRHLIDTYVIIDTGSTDDTKHVIRRELGGIEGYVYDRPWINFGHNRTEAIELAVGKADYILVVDADDEIVGPKPTNLTADVYNLKVEDSGSYLMRPQLFRANASFRYVGVVHEYLDCTDRQIVNLSGLRYVRHTDGARWGKRDHAAIKAKYTQDALLLEAALEKEPENERYVFYLAQSWRDAREYEKALGTYELRAALTIGWDEERWYALFQVAFLKRLLMYPQAEITDAYLKAFEFRPSRMEPMFELGGYLQLLKRHQLCYHLLKPLLGAQVPNDRLYVVPAVYTWGLKDVLAGSAYFVGDTQTSKTLNEELLAEGHLPPEHTARVNLNLASLR